MRILFKTLIPVSGFFLLIFFSSTSYINFENKERHVIDKFHIDSCLNIFSPENIIKSKTGYQYWFVDKNFLNGKTIKMSVVDPHSAFHPPHSHEADEFYFILEGTAEFYLNGETREAGAYSSFYCPPMSEHGIKNIGNGVLKYLVIREYK